MKKLLVAFVLGFSVFAGFAQASEILKCEWKKTNPELQKVCIEARHLEVEAGKWVRLDVSGESTNKKYLDEEIIIRMTKRRNGYAVDEPICLIELKDAGINCGSEREKIVMKGAKKEYAKGYILMGEILNNQNGENVFSNLEKEKMFMEAIDYFKQAKKLARKPVIHSGGILPGPKSEEDGESYFANKFLTKVINGALVILFSAGTLILIIGGIMFLISSGEEEMKTKAKDTIFWGIVGIVIAVMAYAIVKFVVGLDFGF